MYDRLIDLATGAETVGFCADGVEAGQRMNLVHLPRLFYE